MKPSPDQITMGAVALAARQPDPSAVWHEQTALQVLTPVLSDMEQRVYQLEHEDHCDHHRGHGCACLLSAFLAIVGGRP